MLRYGTKLHHARLRKLTHASGYGHVLLLECHSVALYPQTSDANAAQDVIYACPHGGVCSHFIGVAPLEFSLDHRKYTWRASVCTIGEETLKPSNLLSFSCPLINELLPAALRARAYPTDVFKCFFHPLAALELAANVILPAFVMKEIQLPH